MDIKDLQSADAVVNEKNAEVVTTAAADNKEVITATPSGYGDRMDRDRANDAAALDNDISPADIRANNKALRGTRVSLKGFARNAAVQALAQQDQSGKSEAQQQQDGLALIQQATKNTYHLANEQAAAGTQEPVFADDLRVIRAVMARDEDVEKVKQATGFGDMIGAAFNQTTAIPALLQSMNRPEYPADPNYDYNARRDSVELGLSEDDRQFMRQSRSLAEEQARLTEVKTRQQELAKIGQHGALWATAASLTGGMLDPVGWGVGLGVGKAAQVVGMGANAAFKAGQVARGVGLGAVEGTVGNVAITALVDAAGGHVTDRDYAYAAGFGMAFGGFGALAGMRGATSEAAEARLSAAADDVARAHDEALMDAHVMMRDAREAAGAKVTDVEPDESIVGQVQAEAQQMHPITEIEQHLQPQQDRDLAQIKGAEQSAHKVLDDIAANHEDPILREQAAYLRGLIGDDVKIVTAKGISFSGKNRAHFDAAAHEIRVSPDDTPDTLVHEVTHAMTWDRLNYGVKNPDTAIGTLTKEFEALRAVTEKAVKAAGKDAPHNASYFAQNLDEFSAGLFSGDNKYLSFLAGIPVRSDGKSLLKSIVGTVRKLMGLPADKESVLTRALHVHDDLLNMPVQVTTVKYGQKSKRRGSGQYTKEYSRYIGAEQHRAGQAIQEGAAAETVHDLNKVASRVSHNPDPAAVQAELDNMMQKRYEDAMNIVHARVGNNSRFLPVLDQQTTRANGSVVFPNEILQPKSVRAALGKRWGIDDVLVKDQADVQMLTEMAVRAERWASANPVDAARVDSILGKMPWLASTGLQLAKSEHPVARMIAGLLLENTTGALGRGRTAALDKSLLQRQYAEHLSNAEQHYTSWRNRHNGNIATDIMSGELRDRFMREVTQEIRSREIGNERPVASDVDVVKYADALEAGYDRMRVDQQARHTIGAERLGTSSRGYAPRRISRQWARAATLEQRRALSREFADQLEAEWNDRAFAEKIAAGYVERARAEAGGGVQPPTNLYSDEANDILRDVMRTGGVPDDQIEKLMGKFSRGGQGYTKARLDLDLDKTVKTELGDEFYLGDAFEHDQSRLYQDYMRRVSGEVALANFGVFGKHGMMQLRRLMADFGPNGKPASINEVKAFDQIAAEFYGTPLPGTGNKAMGNLRLLSSMSMLGGMAFNQFAEFANALPLLGLGGTLRYVAELPGLIKAAHSGKESPILSSIELVGGPIGQDQRVVFPYQNIDDTQVWGAGDLNAFDRVLRAGAQAMPWLSAFHYVHAAQVRGISEQIVLKAMRYIREDQEQAALLSMGFHTNLRERIKADLDNIATFDAQGKLDSLDITKSKDPEAMSEFVQAVHRGSNQIIQGTFIGETGKWAHDDFLRLLTQFRTFSITSMEKQWSRQRANQGTLKAFGLLLGTMSFAIPIQLARVQLNAIGKDDPDEYRERQLAPGLFARNLLNYSSVSGTLGDIIDAGAALTGHTLSGGRASTQSSPLDVVPAVGYINNLVQGIQKRDPRELLRSLPGQNLPFLIPLMNLAE